MDTLIIQDVFEPYYADRRPFRVSLRAIRLAELRALRAERKGGRAATASDERRNLLASSGKGH